MRKIFKKLLCGVLAASAVALCAGCETRPTSGGGDGEISGELKVWGINPICVPGYDQMLEMDPGNTNAKYTKWLIESFEEKYPDVEISLETAGWELELNKNIMTAIAAGTQPDTMATATYTPLLARYGHLAELTLPEDIEEDLVTTLDDFCFHQGTRYAVPITQQCFQIAINKDVLRKAGILNDDDTPTTAYADLNPLAPETWEDLLEICQAIKTWANGQSGDNNDIGGFLMCTTSADSHVRALAIMAAAGGDFADNYGNVYLDSPENIKAYEFCRKLWQTTPYGNDGAHDLASLNAMFYDGLAAYYFLDPETITPIVQSGGYALKEEDVAYCELPQFEGSSFKSNVSTGGILFAVLAEGDNVPAAKAFVEHLLSYEAQKNVFDIIGRIPVRKSVLRDIQEENSEWYQIGKNGLDPFLDDSYVINKGIPVFENNSSLCWDAWNGMWQDVCLTNENITDLVRECAQDWVRYLAEED